jgi:hypothetical protein
VERRDQGSREVRARVGRSRLRVMCMVVLCKMYLRTLVVGQADFDIADEVLTAQPHTLGNSTRVLVTAMVSQTVAGHIVKTYSVPAVDTSLFPRNSSHVSLELFQSHRKGTANMTRWN